MTYPHGYVKRNFFTGQFDREFSGQENAISAAGMIYCKNVLTSPQGECKTRPGTEFLGDVDSESVIIPYRRDNKDLALVFSDSKLDIKTFNAAGDLVDFVPATKNVIHWTNTSNTNPSSTQVSVTGEIQGNLENAYRFWSYNGYDLTSGYAANRLYVGTSSLLAPKTYFNMRFTAKKALTVLGMEIMTADGNWSAGYQRDTVRNWINNAVVQYSDDNSNWFNLPLVRPVYWSTKRESTPGGVMPAQMLVFEALDTSPHEYWRVLVVWNRQNMLNNAPFLAHFYDTVYEEVTSSVQSFTTPFTLDLLKKLKYSQQYGELLICDGVHNPQRFSMTGNVPSFAQASYSFIEQDGVPSCVRFFQNRLYYGGFATYPTRVRASRFGDYTDFNIVTQGATVADPISVECNQFSERITDLWGGFTVLYAQSPDGIAFVTGMSSTPDFTLRCSERASGITPTMKDNIMYYVGFDRRKIHAFSYDFNIQQFVAPDISRYWQEVLKNRVAEIHYVDSRSKCIIGSLEDGTGFFLFHEGGDIGYFPFDINGFISDISVVKDGDDMRVLMVVQRNGTYKIERLHMPEFMRATNSFEQNNWDKNLATQENIKKSPFFDSWHNLKDEHNELWLYNAQTKIISPIESNNASDLSSYVGKTIRFYMGDGIRDYADVKIQKVYTEQQTEEREISVTEQVAYYFWQNVSAVNVVAHAGYTPAYSGVFTRDSSKDNGIYKAYIQGSYVGYVAGFTPAIGDVFYKHGARGFYGVSHIGSMTETHFWTKSLTPVVGDPVYDDNYNQIGVVESVGAGGIVFNGIMYYNKSTATKYHEETHTEIIEVVVTPGEYAVECDLTTNVIFNKFLLPIESIVSDNEIIQIQDNGVYQGQYTGIKLPDVSRYQWTYNNVHIYTYVDSPSIGDYIYNRAGLKIGVVSDIDVEKITYDGVVYSLDKIEVGTSTQIGLYAWVANLYIYVEFSNTDKGLLRRQYNLDIPGNTPLYGWRGRGIARNWIYYTRNVIPSVGDPVYNSNQQVVGTITQMPSAGAHVYTDSATPAIGDFIYDTQGQITTSQVTTVGDGFIVYLDDYYQVFRDASADQTYEQTVEVPLQVSTSGYSIELKEPMYEIQYGIPYRKIGVVEDNRSYLRQKGWGAVAFNVIDTMALKVGIKLDKLTNMVKWDGKQFFDSNVIMKNGTLICNIKDMPQYEKHLIFMTDEGLPFTVLAIETAGEISDRGAN